MLEMILEGKFILCSEWLKWDKGQNCGSNIAFNLFVYYTEMEGILCELFWGFGRKIHIMLRMV